MKKILALTAVAVLVAGPVGVAGASVVAAAEPAKSYGGCVSKSTGYLRVLERNDLAKSALGKCRKTERKITFPSVTGVAPGKIVFKRPAETETCLKTSASQAAWTFSCTSVPVATPSPSLSPTASPSPTVVTPSPTFPPSPTPSRETPSPIS